MQAKLSNSWFSQEQLSDTNLPTIVNASAQRKQAMGCLVCKG